MKVATLSLERPALPLLDAEDFLGHLDLHVLLDGDLTGQAVAAAASRLVMWLSSVGRIEPPPERS
jgi:hypothetical protein